VDWYFIIDRVGYVYLMGFLEQDGKYYYLEHDTLAPNGIYTKLDFEMDTQYYSSAYFDGEMLYYSAYKESRNHVTLFAIDVAGGSKACYELGTFADGVWPVAGLMEPGEVKNHIGVIMTDQTAQTMSLPVAVEPQKELKGIREAPAQGTLNSAAASAPAGEAGEELVSVDITLPEAGTNADLTVSFDDSMLELAEVSGNASAFAWKAADGQVKAALAEADEISESKTVARLSFRPLESGVTTVSIVTDRLGDQESGNEERLDLVLEVEKPHEHSYEAVVTAPTCTEGGYTTYTCDCGESYMAEETPPLGHDWDGSSCTRCDAARENPFVDVPEGSFYYDAVLWAVQEEIAAGLDATHFGPNAACTRAQVVTFLWRAAGCPEPQINKNPFDDVEQDSYFYSAVLWAVEQGITSGISADKFGPNAECTRAQIVTFLWRSQGSPAVNAELSFDDVQPGQYYTTAVAWALEKGITYGVGDNLFGLDTVCNRAQVVTFLHRTKA